eukprot:TRINITY_DN120710_c2_g1_i1.p6 TRINITY_DN120710_c2_g1~~TRINITY_DN120710_c2_g1_i1.p6  ORF type:complete len:181 (+),score=38.12 TRINITY_DN120710_c2_g1_i1:485-1027(+)
MTTKLPKSLSLPKIEYKQKLVVKDIDRYKQEYMAKLEYEFKKRAQDEAELRAKSRAIRDKQERAAQVGKTVIERKVAKAVEHKRKVEETSKRIHDLMEVMWKTRAERYEEQQEEIEKKIEKKARLEMQKLMHYRESSERYRKKLNNIKTSRGASPDDLLLDETLEKYETECTCFYIRKCS